MIKAFDDAIRESIDKLMDAKTGTEVKTFIVEFEELMFARTKLFTQMVMQERREKENKMTAQVAKSPSWAEEMVDSIKKRRYTGTGPGKEGCTGPYGEAVEVEGTMTANYIYSDNLTRGDVHQRTAAALLKFVERAAYCGSTRTPEADIAALPDAARVLLEISEHLAP